MDIWLIKLGEQAPLDEGSPKLSRTAMIARELSDAGHNVTWWMSTFDHLEKKQRSKSDFIYEFSNNYKINFIFTPGYRKNFSIKRMLDHWVFDKKLKRRIKRLPPPDLIISSYPTIGACVVLSNYAEKNKIPMLTDVRDMWPDIFKYYMPKYTRWLYGYFFYKNIRQAKKVFSNSTGLIAITEDFLNWALSYAERSRSVTDYVAPLGYFEPPNITTKKIPNNVDFPYSFGIGKEDFVICYFGVMSKKIDLRSVASGFKKITKAYPNVKLVICGDGDELSNIKKLFCGIDNVFFSGWINSLQIQELIKVSSIGLAPYKADREDFLMSMPTKIIEYLSGGLPVVSSLGGHSLSVIKDFSCGAFYYDELSFFKIIRNYILNPSELRLASRNASDLYKERYQGKIVYSKLREHIEKTLTNCHN